jgi:signal recognition particle subunit SRP54
MGSISSLLKMIPGLNKLKDVEVDEKEFVRIEAMINSMTEEERSNPKILNGSRRLRIANGSGTTVQQINKFMNSFEMTQKMMKQMTSNKGAMRKMMKNMNLDDLNTGDLDLEKMDLKDLGIDLKNLKK